MNQEPLSIRALYAGSCLVAVLAVAFIVTRSSPWAMVPLVPWAAVLTLRRVSR